MPRLYGFTLTPCAQSYNTFASVIAKHIWVPVQATFHKFKFGIVVITELGVYRTTIWTVVYFGVVEIRIHHPTQPLMSLLPPTHEFRGVCLALILVLYMFKGRGQVHACMLDLVLFNKNTRTFKEVKIPLGHFLWTFQARRNKYIAKWFSYYHSADGSMSSALSVLFLSFLLISEATSAGGSYSNPRRLS